MTLKDTNSKSMLITSLLLFTLIVTLSLSGCSQAGKEESVGNTSLNNLLEKNDSPIPTRHEVMNELSKLGENPDNISIGYLFGIGFEDYNIFNLTRSLQH